MNPQAIWIAYRTILNKEVGRVLRIWKQTLLPPLITQTLYFLIFGAFIGSRVGEIDGVPYMAFIVPGLVMMAVIQNAFSNVVSSFYSARFMRNIDEILVSPMPNWTILAGFVSGGVVRALLTGVMVIAVSVAFTRPEMTHPFAIVAFAVLTATVFALGGFLNGLFARSFDDIGLFGTFFLTPLTYLGGVFYSVSSLPEPWQSISAFNPIVYMIDGFRYGFYGTASFNPWISASVLLCVAAAAWALNMRLLRQGVGLKQ